MSGLVADLANRWYDTGEFERALQYASSTLTWDRAGVAERYAAWLVTALAEGNEFGLAERADKALLLADEASLMPKARSVISWSNSRPPFISRAKRLLVPATQPSRRTSSGLRA